MMDFGEVPIPHNRYMFDGLVDLVRHVTKSVGIEYAVLMDFEDFPMSGLYDTSAHDSLQSFLNNLAHLYSCDVICDHMNNTISFTNKKYWRRSTE